MRASPTCIAFSLACVCAALSAQPQQFVSEHLTAEQGLVDNSVPTIHQSADGLLWIATFGGINTFDGYAFRPLYLPGIEETWTRLYPAQKADKLWVGTPEGGFFLLDQRTHALETFDHLVHDPMVASTPGINTIQSLYEDSAGVLWFGTSLCLNRYDIKQGILRCYRMSLDGKKNIPYATLAIHRDHSGTLWVGTMHGLYTVNDFSGTLRRSPLLEVEDSVNVIVETQADDLWIGTRHHGALRIRPDRNSTTRLFHGEEIMSILPDGEYVLFGTRSGKLYWFDPSTEEAGTVAYGDAAEHARPIMVLLRDCFGVLWIGTEGRGIWKLVPESYSLAHYRYAPPVNGLSRRKAVWTIAELQQGKSILVGTGNGLATLDREAREYRTIAATARGFATRAIVEDGPSLWLALLGNGLTEWNRNTGQWTFYNQLHSDSITKLRNVSPYCLLRDKSGDLWVGSNGGMVAEFNPMTHQFTNYIWERPPDWVVDMCEDSAGGLWVGVFSAGVA
jgi:ligand-binding sensor domain-containing protein